MILNNEHLLITTNIMDDVVVATLAGDLTEEDNDMIIQKIMKTAHNRPIDGVLIVLSSLQIIDVNSYKALSNVSRILKLLDIDVGWVGLQPGVTAAIMDYYEDMLEIDVSFNLTLEDGIKKIKSNRAIL